jgi:hypothetical protein
MEGTPGVSLSVGQVLGRRVISEFLVGKDTVFHTGSIVREIGLAFRGHHARRDLFNGER